MTTLKAKELRSLSVDELSERAEGFRKELFQLRVDTKLAKIENLMKYKQMRHDLAKVLTVKREMTLNPNSASMGKPGVEEKPAKSKGGKNG